MESKVKGRPSESFGTYMLDCGHEGKIIFRANIKYKTIGVQGTDHRCTKCGKRSEKDGSWSPTVYLIRTVE